MVDRMPELPLVVCDWPECSASYVIDPGPKESGWIRTRQFWAGNVFCPAHAATGHWPSASRTEGAGHYNVTCACGAAGEVAVGNGCYPSKAWWDQHVTETVTVGQT